MRPGCLCIDTICGEGSPVNVIYHLKLFTQTDLGPRKQDLSLKLFSRREIFSLFTACLIALAGFGLNPLAAHRPVQAAAEIVVQVSPSALDVALGGSAALSLEVLGGVDVNAYDVTVRYDPAVITFVSWSHGGYLSHLAQVYKVDEPGRLRLVFTQLATPPVSGDGTLLNLVFRGAAAGASEVWIEALDFAGSDGVISSPQLIGGTVNVDAAQPTAAPTNTLPPRVVVPTVTLGQPTSLPVSATPRVMAAIATPDLSRTAPVHGTATPTRSLTRSTLAITSTTAAIALNTPSGGTSAAVPTQAPPPDDEQAASNSDNLLNLALWAVLGIFVIAFVWMGLSAIRRSKTQPLDKE